VLARISEQPARDVLALSPKGWKQAATHLDVSKMGRGLNALDSRAQSCRTRALEGRVGVTGGLHNSRTAGSARASSAESGAGVRSESRGDIATDKTQQMTLRCSRISQCHYTYSPTSRCNRCRSTRHMLCWGNQRPCQYLHPSTLVYNKSLLEHS
jgi:hypothetical protein